MTESSLPQVLDITVTSVFLLFSTASNLLQELLVSWLVISKRGWRRVAAAPWDPPLLYVRFPSRDLAFRLAIILSEIAAINTLPARSGMSPRTISHVFSVCQSAVWPWWKPTQKHAASLGFAIFSCVLCKVNCDFIFHQSPSWAYGIFGCNGLRPSDGKIGKPWGLKIIQ